MKKIDNIIKLNTYADKSFINQYIYMKREDNEFEDHYIFLIKDIIIKNPPEYIVNKCYKLKLAKTKDIKCNTINNINNIQLTTNDIIYIIDINEYINIFRVFVTFENMIIHSLPISNK